MNASTLASVLADHRRLLLQALPSFERSLSKCRSIPLDKEPLSFEAEESFDSLTFKFARISDIFTQKLLKSLVLYLREDAPTFLDRMNLCEKLGVIPSAESIRLIGLLMFTPKPCDWRTACSLPSARQKEKLDLWPEGMDLCRLRRELMDFLGGTTNAACGGR